MVRRRNRSKEPAEKGYECIEEGCDSVVKNRFFPEHYETHHRMRSGRFECSICGYKCSNKAVCISKHIRRVHKNSEARVIYNPYLNQEECRIKNEHTDECGDEKAKVKPKRIRKVSKKKTTGKGKNKRQAARGSKDTINEIVVADETEEMDLPAASRCKRNLEPDFERPAKRKRFDNLISNSDVTSTAREQGKHLDLVIEEEDDVITIEEIAEEEDSEVATSDDESENEETSSKITSNQSFRGTSAENNGNNISKQNLKQGEDSEEEEEDDDIIDDETIDYDDAGSDESDESGVEEVEIENVIVKTEKNEDDENQEVSEANPTDEDRIRKRMEIDRHVQLVGHINAHDRYSEAMFDDLIEDLISKFTTNPKQPTTNLIEELTGRNPHELIWNKVSCPSKLGDETKINEVLESVIESANKLQVHVIELLISTSKGFKKELAKKLWKTLKLRVAVYRVDETMGNSEELKVKLLSLKCLHEAYKKANR